MTGIVDRRDVVASPSTASTRSATYRRRRWRPGGPDDGYGDLYVVVDGWGRLRPELEDVEEGLQRLAARGLAYGVHLRHRDLALGGLPPGRARPPRHPGRAASG